jgi:hypothetical protein
MTNLFSSRSFFTAGLRMPLHPVLTDILLKFQVQLHQLTPNAIAQLSKYSWVVTSFRGIPSTNGFAKRYGLHYQPKKIKVDGAFVEAQFGCLNFHAKRYKGGRAKLTLAIKNKWSAGWLRAWFYYKVLLLQSPHKGKGMFTQHSSMSHLDYMMKPSFECVDDDSGDAAFVRVMGLIGGRDTVEEYLACRMFSLSTNLGFAEISEDGCAFARVPPR